LTLLPLRIFRKEKTMETEVIKPASREDFENQLHFSYSQLSTFILCGFKYAHQYVWGTPWETKPVALPFGKAIHKAAEVYYRSLKDTGEVIPVEQVIGTYEMVFDNDMKSTDIELTLKEGETVGALREQGKELLKLFCKEIRPQKIAAIESPFSVPIPDILNGGGDLPIKMVGYFDLVERDEQGTYLIAELKTSGQRFSSLRLEYDLQATTYSYAMTRMKAATSENSCLVRYDVLLKTKKPAFEHYFVTRTDADHKRLIHLINHVLRAIELRVFYRNTGWQCGDCQFKKACFA
jgi:CRISPR/Cas system-associated exonuclease Cas4 (RecB family)